MARYMLLQPNKDKDTWKRGLIALIFLAPFFFLTYGFSNQYAASLAVVPSIMFEWEYNIPLLPWTIIPYWSIDLFYGLSLLLCWNKFELKQQVFRLFTAQLISVICFIVYPLKFSLERPELHGFFALWFDVLMGFDQPFNQAPSLHIVLLIILWDFYRRHTKGFWKYGVDIWSLLIAISVLTTWQHHFIDVPTGVLVGALCLWLFPVSVRSPLKQSDQNFSFQHYKLANYYLIGALLCVAIAWVIKGVALWFIFPAISLFFVALAYILVRPHFFQKQINGQMTVAAQMLFSPYLCLAWLNSRIWTKQHPEDSFILTHQNISIYLGRIPNTVKQQQYQALFDCCAELSLTATQHYQAYLSLDLIPLQAEQLKQAVQQFDQLWQQSYNSTTAHKLLIFCALGYSRSTSILIAWLLKNHLVQTVDEAIQLIQKNRPWIVLKAPQIEAIHVYLDQLTEHK